MFDEKIFKVVEASASTQAQYELHAESGNMYQYSLYNVQALYDKKKELDVQGQKTIIKRIVNSYYTLFSDARELLIKELKQRKLGNAPNLENLLKIILYSGTALHNFLDRASTEKKYKQRLEAFIDDYQLIKEYIDTQHLYYLATKHIEKEDFKKCREKVFGREGIHITYTFYNCIRNIFICHFAQNTLQQWDILDNIDF
jgi:hypothetical protein